MLSRIQFHVISMLIRELINFDNETLSQKQLFYDRLPGRFKILVALLFLLIGISFFLALYMKRYWVKGLFLLCMPMFLYFIFRLSQKSILPLLQKHLWEAQLSSTNIWGKRNILIQKIQYHKLSVFINSKNFKSPKKILFIMDVLKSEANKPKYIKRIYYILTFDHNYYDSSYSIVKNNKKNILHLEHLR